MAVSSVIISHTTSANTFAKVKSPFANAFGFAPAFA